METKKNSDSHIRITIEPETSGDGPESYTDITEKYLRDVKSNCIRYGKHHSNIARRHNQYNFVLSFIVHSIPLILINLTIFSEDSFKIIQCVFLTISVICNSFISLKKYDRSILENMTISKKYCDLVDDIDKNLVRKKKYRPPFEVLIETINAKLINLNEIKSGII